LWSVKNWDRSQDNGRGHTRALQSTSFKCHNMSERCLHFVGRDPIADSSKVIRAGIGLDLCTYGGIEGEDGYKETSYRYRSQCSLGMEYRAAWDQQLDVFV